MWRHKKTGGEYRVIDGAVNKNVFIEATGEPAVIYQSLKDHKIWVRPRAEFFDGRFEPIDDDD